MCNISWKSPKFPSSGGVSAKQTGWFKLQNKFHKEDLHNDSVR